MTCLCGTTTGKLRRGKCGACYMRWLRSQPASLRKSVDQRFAEKVRGGAGCWEWAGTKTSKGYGQFWPGRSRHVYAHRWAWEKINGTIPDGLTIDHLCKNRGCVNPSHMEVVSRGENAMRGNGPAAINARKTHCPAGHSYDGANTYSDSTGRRYCRPCNRAAGARYRRRKRSRRAAIGGAP